MDNYRMFFMKDIVLACNQYILENNGKLPDTLQYVFEDYEYDRLISPITKDRTKSSYKIVLKGNIDDYPDKSNTVMIIEITPNERRNKLVVYLDGRIEIIDDN